MTDEPTRAPTDEELARFLAEADHATAQAERERAEAIAVERKSRAEVRKLEAEAIALEFSIVKLRIEAEREEHKRRKELAADEFYHTYLFDKDVTESSVKACITQLSAWERTAAGNKPLSIDLQINSPGGSIFDGFALVDYIAGMHTRGHTVNTTAYGMAASMGGVLLQTGKARRMGASAMLLIHEASFGAAGSMGKIEDQVELAHLLQERILDLFAERAKGSQADRPITRQQIKRRWQRKDWWLPAAECLKFGFIDEIV